MSTYTLRASGTGDIIPLLLNGVDNGNGTMTFTVTGIGMQQTDQSVFGDQTFDFGLTSGSGAVTATTYFGWTNTVGSFVSYNYDPSGQGTYLHLGADNLGATFTLLDGTQENDTLEALNNRIYDINATSVEVTPEPSSLMLLGTGVAGIAGLARRRFKA